MSATSSACLARGLRRTTRHTDKRAADRRPTNQVSAWQAEVARHARDITRSIIARLSRGCYEETDFVEFQLNGTNSGKSGVMYTDHTGRRWCELADGEAKCRIKRNLRQRSHSPLGWLVAFQRRVGRSDIECRAAVNIQQSFHKRPRECRVVRWSNFFHPITVKFSTRDPNHKPTEPGKQKQVFCYEKCNFTNNCLYISRLQLVASITCNSVNVNIFRPLPFRTTHDPTQ